MVDFDLLVTIWQAIVAIINWKIVGNNSFSPDLSVSIMSVAIDLIQLILGGGE